MKRLVYLCLLFVSIALIGAACNAGSANKEMASADNSKAAGGEYEEEGRMEPSFASMPQNSAAKDNRANKLDDFLDRGSGQAVPKTPAPDAEPKKATDTEKTARMIVYRAWLRLGTHQPAETLDEARAITEAAGGFIESSSKDHVVLRIPSAKYESTYALLRKLGELRHERVTSQDVTEQYTNLAARIENLEALKTRYEVLLAQAKTMKERLAIERELLEISQELTVLRERLIYLADQAAYATVTLNVEKIQPAHISRNRPAQPFRWVRKHGVASLFGG